MRSPLHFRVRVFLVATIPVVSAIAVGCEPPVCAVPQVGAGGTDAISIDGMEAFEPDVFRARNGRFIAYVPAVTFGDGALYRAESDDGLTFRTPQRLRDDFGTAFVFEDDAGFTGFFETPYGEFGSPAVQIAKATSSDGLAWSDLRVVFASSGDVAEKELHSPKLFRRDGTLHLYFTSYRDVCIEDVCGVAGSIGHALSADDGETFSFDSWLFRGGLCPDSAGDTGRMEIRAFARPACAEACTSDVVIIATGHLCGEAGAGRGAYELRSEDGVAFTGPTPIDGEPHAGTILVGSNGALSLGVGVSGGVVRARPSPSDVQCSSPDVE